MKTLKLIIISLLCILFTGIAHQAFAVAESGANDTWNASGVINLPLGSTGTGGFSPAGEMDWWRVTSTTDGKLTINWSSTNGQNVYCEVFDTLGTYALSTGTYTAGSSVINIDGLTAGTYYIRLRPYYGTETTTYSFVPTWTTPTQANDAEPNATKATALTLPLNGSVTGHIGYYYKNLDDTLDWYKVTTNKDGRLDYTITSNNGQNVYAELFDNDGTTYLVGSYTTSSATYSKDGLAVGTYYIRVRTYYQSEFAPYTLSNTLVLPPVVIDAEPNSTPATAVTIAPGDSAVGHINYYYNHKSDTLDWYKVTTTKDGRLDYTMNSLNGQNVYLQLYDNDGVTNLGGDYTTSTNTWSTDGLAAGTYYLRIKTYYNTEWAPYKIKVNLVTPVEPIDVEPNGTRALATTLNPNDSITGHIGYYYNHARDTFDYRKIVITGYGKLDWTIHSSNGKNVYALLYDNNGTTNLGGNYTTGTASYSVDGLAPGTYYMLIRNYYTNSEYSPYYLTTKYTIEGTDAEPNGTKALAKTKVLNDSLLGTVGYYYNGVRDTNDWFKITTTNDGQLSVKLYINNGNNVWLTVYDNNGTTALYQQYSAGGVLSFSRNDLGKGTYYIKVNCYYNNQFAPYALVTKFVSAGTNDAEPNNFAAKGVLDGGYVTKTGNVGYYYNLKTDVVDWFKFDYHATVSTLNVVLTKKVHTFDANYPDLLYRLYKDTTLAPIDSVVLAGGVTLNYNHTYTTLTTATYYVRITNLNNSFGAYTLKGTYRDTASQTITNLLTSTDTICGNGKLSYLVKQGLTPYSVQLFKDGIAVGAPVSTNDTAKFTGVAPGRYFARATSTGASTYFKASTTITFIPPPSGTTATAVTGHTATINWNSLPCVDGFLVGYKKSTVSTYTTDSVPAGSTSHALAGLLVSTAYNYRVAAFHRMGSTVYVSAYSAVKNFTTTAGPRLGDDENNNTVATDNLFNVYPNPSSGLFTVDLSNVKLNDATINVCDLQGRIISSEIVSSENELTHTVDLSAYENGVYIMTINSESGTQSVRLIKE